MRLLSLLMLVVATGAAAHAQTPAPVPPQQVPASPAPAPSAAVAPLEPAGFNYEPQGRRDPFVTLVRRGAETPGSAPGTRPAGLGGFTVDEVSLRGTVKGREGFVAMLQATDNKTYLVRPGDRLLDGSVRAITATAVVIVQRVNDPLSLETEREVRKVLRQTEEAK